MTQDIITAIEQKLLLLLEYAPGDRVVEPHAYGRSKSGAELLRAYQVAGATSSGDADGWKLFRVDRAGMIAVGDRRFEGPRAGYRRNDRAMVGGIIAQL